MRNAYHTQNRLSKSVEILDMPTYFGPIMKPESCLGRLTEHRADAGRGSCRQLGKQINRPVESDSPAKRP